MTVADALKILNHKGHTFLAGEFQKTVTIAIASLGGQLPEDEQTSPETPVPAPNTPQGGMTPSPIITDPVEAMIQSRGYTFPSNAR
jgi:hypothetical protein